MENYISENGFNYKSVGDGQPLVILHGLMGGLSNFEGLFDFFPKHGYAVIAPELPVYNSTLLNTNVKYFAKYVKKFIGIRVMHDASGGTIHGIDFERPQMLVQPGRPGEIQPITNFKVSAVPFGATAVHQPGVTAHLFG